MSPFPKGRRSAFAQGLNSDHVWFKACPRHYSWRVDTLHLILLTYCNNKLLASLQKRWIECSGGHSPSWNYIPDAEGISPAWYVQKWKPTVMNVLCGHVCLQQPPHSSRYNASKWSQMKTRIDMDWIQFVCDIWKRGKNVMNRKSH